MKNFSLLTLVTILLFSCNQGQKEEVFTNPEQDVFPDSWTGRYEGPLYVTTHGAVVDTNHMLFQMYRLDMERTAFQVKYDTDSALRDYILLPGKTPSHFILDEQNSILIDYYYQNNELTAKFSVEDNLLDINLRKHGDSIIATTRIIPLQFTKETGDSVKWEIMRYKEKSVQRAVMTKVKDPKP